MLYTGCILKDDSVGTRISIMSRHTLNDGVTLDPRITEDSYDEWLKILAPTDKLIGDYYRRGLDWELFAVKYTSELMDKRKSTSVENLALRAIRDDLTILCIEESSEYCHRRLLAEECKRYFPNLEVIHLDS